MKSARDAGSGAARPWLVRWLQVNESCITHVERAAVSTITRYSSA